MKNNETFRFTYCAAQQQEVERIRSKYLAPQEDKLQTLRRLDGSAARKARIWGLILGILGTLLLGTGMSLIMTDLSQKLGLSCAMPVGIGVGLGGLLLAALAYPVYARVLAKERRRIAPEILRLSDELLK